MDGWIGRRYGCGGSRVLLNSRQQATRDGRCYDMLYAGDVPNERNMYL